ncbi:hypothetical protein M1M07_23845 [Rhodococcus sp. HM1]|uniref:hypothetical protein n=1 Tax=Rhodococcus sp. HM1 TaxID=2937759 RepID=UPI00200AC0D4|nr:hypothetical protein [Rhodococcus sp. HM1]MCK8674131.1 hypothetical protein [Rhodococcus sp. HM1]
MNTRPNEIDVRIAAAGIGFFAARNRKPRTDTPIHDALWDEQRPPMFREED